MHGFKWEKRLLFKQVILQSTKLNPYLRDSSYNIFGVEPSKHQNAKLLLRPILNS